jgi:hypothetical protein
LNIVHLIFYYLNLAMLLYSFYEMYILDDIFDESVIRRLENSWSKTVLSNNFRDSQKPCTEHDMTELISYTWEGTEEGCLCSGEVRKGKCTQNNCKNIPRSPRTILRKWKGYHFCGGLKKNQTYHNLEKISPGSTCPINFKLCGEIDTIGQILCVKVNENCPLQNFFIKENANPNSLSLSYGGGANKKTKIFNSFQIFESDICFEPERHKQLHYSENNYPLVNNIVCPENVYNKGDYRYDTTPRFQILDKYNKNTLLKHNGVNYSQSYNEVAEKISVQLYGELYIGWKNECRLDNKEMQKLFKLAPEMKKIHEYNYFYIKVFIAISIILWANRLVHLFNGIDQGTFINLLSFGFNYVLYYHVKDNINIDFNSHILKILIEGQCSDPYTNGSLKLFATNLDSVVQITEYYLMYKSFVLMLFNFNWVTSIMYSEPKLRLLPTLPKEAKKEEVKTSRNVDKKNQ